METLDLKGAAAVLHCRPETLKGWARSNVIPAIQYSKWQTLAKPHGYWVSRIEERNHNPILSCTFLTNQLVTGYVTDTIEVLGSIVKA